MIELQFCGQGGVVFMKRRRGCLHSFFLLVLTAVILIGFWYFENNVIQTEVFELASRRLPAAFDGFRIVELADLHGRQFGPGGRICCGRSGRQSRISLRWTVILPMNTRIWK